MPAATFVATQTAISGAMSAANHRRICEVLLDDFSSRGASVEAMHRFAECVNYLHPVGDSSWIYKLAILVILLGMLAGIIWGFLQGSSDDIIGGGALGLLGGCMVALLGWVTLFLIYG